MKGKIAFFLLLAFFVAPWRLMFGQATPGFVKVGTVSFGTNGFVDSSPVSGQITKYEVTSFNDSGESGPSNIITLTTPSTNVPHSNTIGWTAPTSGGTPTGYNVYAQSVAPPNPPTALAGASK